MCFLQVFLSDVAFPILGENFLRFLIVEPLSNAHASGLSCHTGAAHLAYSISMWWLAIHGHTTHQ
jgi:hypothetical protein